MMFSIRGRFEFGTPACFLGGSEKEGLVDDQGQEAQLREVLPEAGVIRKLWIGETNQYRDHVQRLDAESRRNRFGGAVSDDFIRGYADLTSSLDAVVHGFFIDGTLRGAAELRPLGLRLPRQAEAAFSIERAWQSHGVGSALLRRTLLAARNRGYRHLHMACLADNRRMQQLARKFDAELTFDFESVIGEVESSRPTPLSLMREMMSDGHGFATALLELHSRILRA
ncbi:MAG: GNAT family N-acetyltransferase [Xanthobacteraceae bacterium]